MPEEKFVPGVDPKLHEWLKVREYIRSLKFKSKNKECVLSHPNFKFHNYWTNIVLSNKSNCTNYNNMKNINHSQIKNNPDKKIFQLLIRNRSIISLPELLLMAYRPNNLVFMDILVDHDMDLNIPVDKNHNRLIHLAVYHGKLDKVSFLLKNGVDISLINDYGENPLHLSMQPVSIFHDIKIVSLLLDAKASLNATDNKGRIPLHRACMLDDIALIEILLKYGSRVYVKDKNGMMPLDFCKEVQI